MKMRTLVIYSEAHKKHHDRDHPENMQRVESIMTRIKTEGLTLIQEEAKKATRDELALAHEEDYIDFIMGLGKMLDKKEHLAERGMVAADNYYSEDTPDAALYAAGGVIKAIDMLYTDKADNGFVLCRPPGHHAEANCAMGFCFFNNVAVGARYAIKRHKAKRVFIFDFDVHHGNGTQHIFERHDNVFYCSIHQFPHYPGTGRNIEDGEGKGKGYTLNLPVRAGRDEEVYMALLKGKVLPAIESFRPDLILVSAGFDAHKKDLLGDVMLETESFAKMTRLLKKAAARYCRGRLLYVLEGGYDLDALSDSVVGVLRVLKGG